MIRSKFVQHMMQVNANTLKPFHMMGVQEIEVKEITLKYFVMSESLSNLGRYMPQ